MHPNLSHCLVYIFFPQKCKALFVERKRVFFCEDLFFFFFFFSRVHDCFAWHGAPNSWLYPTEKIKPGVLSKSKLYSSLICISAFSKFRCGGQKVVVHMVLICFFPHTHTVWSKCCISFKRNWATSHVEKLCEMQCF